MRHAPAGSLREVEHAGHDALLQQPAADEFKFELGARAQQSALVSGLAGAAAKGTYVITCTSLHDLLVWTNFAKFYLRRQVVKKV